MLCRRLNRAGHQFFIAAALALPERENRTRISALINGAPGRNYFAAATWARASAGRAALNINYAQQLSLIFQGSII